MAIVEFKDVSRVYTNGEHEQRALDHVNLSLEEGKFIVILGPRTTMNFPSSRLRFTWSSARCSCSPFL